MKERIKKYFVDALSYFIFMILMIVNVLIGAFIKLGRPRNDIYD